MSRMGRPGRAADSELLIANLGSTRTAGRNQVEMTTITATTTSQPNTGKCPSRMAVSKKSPFHAMEDVPLMTAPERIVRDRAPFTVTSGIRPCATRADHDRERRSPWSVPADVVAVNTST